MCMDKEHSPESSSHLLANSICSLDKSRTGSFSPESLRVRPGNRVLQTLEANKRQTSGCLKHSHRERHIHREAPHSHTKRPTGRYIGTEAHGTHSHARKQSESYQTDLDTKYMYVQADPQTQVLSEMQTQAS